MKNGRRRTKDKLKTAFFTLLEEKPYSKITVTEIIEEAGVSRTSFYRHYKDVFDMYDKICEEIIDSLVSEFTLVVLDNGVDFSKPFEKLCEKLDSQQKYVRLICGKNGGRKFFELGFEKTVSFVKDLSPLLNDTEKFALKFVMFSGMATYVKSIIDGTDFDKKHLKMYSRILTMIQKAGSNNE